ncbi:hypothetical protein J6590_008026, partial [Homalodisca vitripennis]
MSQRLMFCVKDKYRIELKHRSNNARIPVATSSVIQQPPSSSTHAGEQEEPEKSSHCCSNCGYARGYDSDINSRIDRLSRHLESLENSVATDVRLILALLRQQGMKPASSMPDSRE